MNEKEKTIPKKEFPYIEILKKSAAIVWQNKFLWWFGLFIALGSPGNFNFSGDNNQMGKSDQFVSTLKDHWQITLIAAVALFAIGIILYLLSLIAKAGLIKSVYKINLGKKAAFRQGWKEGRRYLGKLFLLGLLMGVVIIVVLLILATPAVYLFIIKSWVSAVILTLLAVAIFIPLIFVIAVTAIFAEYYIVLSDLKIWSAIENGYNLLTKNISQNIIFSLLMLAAGMAFGLLFLPLILLALAIGAPTGILLYSLSKIAFGIFIAFAILAALVIVLFLVSVFIAWKKTAWTLFFQEIAKVESKETEKVAEEETTKQVAAAPVSPSTTLKGESLSKSEKT
jgi:hypothetical protein